MSVKDQLREINKMGAFLKKWSGSYGVSDGLKFENKHENQPPQFAKRASYHHPVYAVFQLTSHTSTAHQSPSPTVVQKKAQIFDDVAYRHRLQQLLNEQGGYSVERLAVAGLAVGRITDHVREYEALLSQCQTFVKKIHEKTADESTFEVQLETVLNRLHADIGRIEDQQRMAAHNILVGSVNVLHTAAKRYEEAVSDYTASLLAYEHLEPGNPERMMKLVDAAKQLDAAQYRLLTSYDQAAGSDQSVGSVRLFKNEVSKEVAEEAEKQLSIFNALVIEVRKLNWSIEACPVATSSDELDDVIIHTPSHETLTSDDADDKENLPFNFRR